MSLSLAWPASWLHLVYAMQKNKKKKRKKIKREWLLAWISSLGYHHLDIITYEVATTFSSHLPTDSFPTGYLLHIAYSTRSDQTSANKKYIKSKKKYKIKKNKKTTAQSIPMWSPTIVLTLPSTV
jgi:hypothetical protein